MNTNDLLDQANALKDAARNYAKSLQDANTRNALIEDKLAQLTEKLQDVAGLVDWSLIGDLIADAAISAQGALEALTEALAEADIDIDY